MIAPILSRKGTSKSGAFPKEKAHNERTPFSNTHTSETKSPEGKKEDDVFHRCPFMLADAH